MSKSVHRGKEQRAEEMLTTADRVKIHELYRKHLVEPEILAERYGLDEEAIKAILAKPPPKHTPQWQVRWDDAAGERHVTVCESFHAARTFHAALKDVEWSKVERV